MESAILALEDGTVFEGRALVRPRNAAAKSFSIPRSPAIRRSSPILRMPAKSSFSPIRKSAITAPARTIRNRRRPYIEGLVVREFSAVTSNWRSDRRRRAVSEPSRRSGRFRDGYARAGAPSAVARRDARRAFRDVETNASRADRESARRRRRWRASIWPRA